MCVCLFERERGRGGVRGGEEDLVTFSGSFQVHLSLFFCIIIITVFSWWSFRNMLTSYFEEFSRVRILVLLHSHPTWKCTSMSFMT